MKFKFVTTFPNDFFEDKTSPLISLYQETSRSLTENKKDALVFRNSIREVEASLKENYSSAKISPLIKMLRTIENDTMFWNNRLNGIALFATLDECIIYDLKKSPKTHAVVSDSFHIKPLLKYFQLSKNYQILDLSKDYFQILEGNIYDMSVKELDEEILTTESEILGDDILDPFFTAGTYGGSSGKAIFHGHGGKKEHQMKNTKRLFR